MNFSTLTFAGVLAGVLTSGVAFAGEKKIALNDAPAAVQAAAKKAAGDATISKLTREVEDGKTIFEAEFTVKDVEHSASFADDGTLLEDETEVEISDLPKAISDTVAKALPEGKMKEAAKVEANGKTYFEVDVKAKDGQHEVKVATDGTLMSDKIEKEDND